MTLVVGVRVLRPYTFALALSVFLCTPADAECVVLLHGLARTSSSMNPLQERLEESGFDVANIDYPSRELPIEELAPLVVDAGVSSCPREVPIHFVTHSLGGILVRYYLEQNAIDRLGRVVMLAPPNGGSEVVDSWRHVPGFELLNGPAGLQLGTDADSIPAHLGAVDYDVGVIAGTRSINLILSAFLPNPDDGKVSVERTRVEGMKDFIEVPHSHPFIMRSSYVADQVIAFLKRGEFNRVTP